MKKFDLKAHNNKYFEVTRKAASGTYPNKQVATFGSKVGLGIGIALIVLWGISVVKGQPFGWGSLLAGLATLISNVVNLKRINAM